MDVIHDLAMSALDVIQFGMVQPKTPPLSIRPGPERLARIDAYAAEHRLSRHLAILLMLDEGYRSLTKAQVDGPATRQAKRLEELIDALDHRHAKGIDRAGSPYWASLQMGPDRAKPGSRLKVKK